MLRIYRASILCLTLVGSFIGISANDHQSKKIPLYSMNININNPAENASKHKLLLDGNGAYGAKVSGNLIRNSTQDLNLWRYDFKEEEVKGGNELLYATLLVQPPPSDSEAKIETRVFLFLRKGQRVFLDTYITTLVPGLNFPVGGITLIPKERKINKEKTDRDKEKVDEVPGEEPEVAIGNPGYITDAEPECGSYQNTIATKIINNNKIPCNGRIGWDLAFAWQSPIAPKIPTRNLNYQDKHSSVTEQGFFATFSGRLPNGSGALSRQSIPEDTNAWVLGWSANGTTNRFIKLGPDAKQPITADNFRVESFLSGFMDSDAAATWSVVDVATAVLNGTKLPLIARNDTTGMLLGQFSQLFIVGRTLLVYQDDDDDELTNTANRSDQLLPENLRSGTTIDFSTHLPTK